MSAIAENSTDGPVELVKVLFALFPGYNTLDVAGPLEVLSRSLQDPKDKCKSRAQWLNGSMDALLTVCSQQGLQLPVRRHRSGHDLCPGPYHQG